MAAYFRACGMTSADRSVATGWNNGIRQSADAGDIKGIPGVCVQVKDWTGTGVLLDTRLASVLAETQAQCVAAGAVYPVLIEKRRQCADVGKWFAWLPANVYVALITGTDINPYLEVHPIRVELRYIVHHLSRVTALHSARAAS